MTSARAIEKVFPAAASDPGSGPVPASTVPVARQDLQKRRWRATASDGTELVFSLPGKSAGHLDLLLAGGLTYQVTQIPEQVLAIALPDDPALAAKFGWYFGNRHIPIEVRGSEIVVEAFPTLAGSLERIRIPYTSRRDILRCPAHSLHRH